MAGRKLLVFLGLPLLTGLAFFTLQPAKAEAVTASQWQAGRIIDDNRFFNSNTMDANSIQQFLNAKVPTCDTNGTQIYSGSTTRAQHGTSRGYPPPYTCLKDYRQDTPSKSAETGLCGFYGGGNNSAAEIIYHVSRTCGINPQVLIVLLQKEQSLITDDWPWSIQYRSATGYGCPDTAPCDAQYYGFFNQVWNAARQFKRYARDAHIYNHRANATSFVQYNPNAGCGGTNVFMQSQGTANLYNYTPYQPNQAALNNLYGLGDGCSAYGNRNFWRMYNDWFGPTYGKDYEWEYVGIDISTGSSQVKGNTSVTMTVTAKNTGNQAWSNTNFPIRLGTFAPTDHDSALYHPSWVGRTRLATLNQAVVEPGQNGTFTFTANIPNRNGDYLERFNLVAEGSTWMPDIGFTIHLVITKSTYAWQMVSQSSNQGFTLNPGADAQFTLVAKNTGNTTWSNSSNPVKLATWNPPYSRSPFDPGTWEGPYRAATLQESSVAPGSNGTFVFNVKAPTAAGFYVERFNLVMEGISWLEDPWMEFQVNVGNFYKWQMVSQSSSTGSFVLNKGQLAQFTLVAKNTGNVTWNNSSTPARLATWNPPYRNSPFCSDHTNWVMGCVRAATLQESSVPPGSNGTFVFTIQAPNRSGFFVERFNLVAEGLAWFTDPWMEFNIWVN